MSTRDLKKGITWELKFHILIYMNMNIVSVRTLILGGVKLEFMIWVNFEKFGKNGVQMKIF